VRLPGSAHRAAHDFLASAKALSLHSSERQNNSIRKPPQSKKAIILLDDGLDFLGVAWLGRHHPEHSRRITGWIRTTQLDTSTVVTAVMARACVMALQIMTTP
jgi:hypothetical protein